MKLLFDENVSHKLVDRLSDLYPGSQHVRQLGMASSPDRIVIGYAALMGMVLGTKDADFDDLAMLTDDEVRSSGSTWATAPRTRSKAYSEAPLVIWR